MYNQREGHEMKNNYNNMIKWNRLMDPFLCKTPVFGIVITIFWKLKRNGSERERSEFQ